MKNQASPLRWIQIIKAVGVGYLCLCGGLLYIDGRYKQWKWDKKQKQVSCDTTPEAD